MSAAAINHELDKLDALSSKINSEMISAGRGHETWSETMRLSPASADDLTIAWQTVNARRRDLRDQVERRYGPGAPSRLPKGFGPIKQW
jgi:hypothetical protein